MFVDHSGSLREKLAEETIAAWTFVQSGNPADQMFVVNFNEKVSRGLTGAVRFSNSPDELGIAIGGASAVGTTALYDAIVEAFQDLQKGEREGKVLVVISDGGDNASRSNWTTCSKWRSNRAP